MLSVQSQFILLSTRVTVGCGARLAAGRRCERITTRGGPYLIYAFRWLGPGVVGIGEARPLADPSDDGIAFLDDIAVEPYDMFPTIDRVFQLDVSSSTGLIRPDGRHRLERDARLAADFQPRVSQANTGGGRPQKSHDQGNTERCHLVRSETNPRFAAALLLKWTSIG